MLPVFGELSRAGLDPQGSTGSPSFSMVAALNNLAVDGPVLCSAEKAIRTPLCVPDAENLPSGDTEARRCADGLSLCFDAQL